MLTLGKEGKDKITGFRGIITARAQYLTGCDQYNLVPPVVDGKLPDPHWFDEGRITIIGDGILAEEVTLEKNGGPNRDMPPNR